MKPTMSHVIARVRQRGKEAEKFRKVISDVDLYRLPDELEPFIPYRADYKLDEANWFGVAEFSKKDFYPDFLSEDFLSTAVDKLKKEEFDKLDFLVAIQDRQVYYFQKLSPSYLLSRKSITLGDILEYRANTREIIIKEEPDAIYIKKKDTLYFRNLQPLTGIFKGIDSLFREATREEAETFLQSDFISLENEYSADEIKPANRKRIAMAVDILGTCDDRKKTVIFDSIREYCPDLVTKEGKFRVSSENDLKLLLYGIDQRFYTTPDGEEKRLANSVIRLG